jgi:UDP-N-acetylmuramoyl-tripeptide--D-alanyl-D-alanine ligase
MLKTVGTENNLIGVPMTLLRLTGNEAVAVLEMGMNAPGEIARLVQIACPDVGVITNIGPAHLAGVGGTVAGVASAKAEMLAGMRRDATIAVNTQDEWVVRISEQFHGRRVEFGPGREVEGRTVTDFGLDGVAFELCVAGRVAKVRLRLPGAHNVANALAAAAVSHAIGLSLETIRAGLERVSLPPRRMQVLHLPNGVTVLNDSYNANPANVEAALSVLVRQPGRRIAVLGEMLELGEQSTALHEHVGALAAKAGVDALVAVGAQAHAVARGARLAGLEAAAICVCADPAEAAARVLAMLRARDFVLVKGSRGPLTEEVVRLRGSRMAEVVRLLEEGGG